MREREKSQLWFICSHLNCLPIGFVILGQVIVIAARTKQRTDFAILFAGTGPKLQQRIGNIEGYQTKAIQAAHRFALSGGVSLSINCADSN